MTQLVVIGNFIVQTSQAGAISQDANGVHVGGSISYPLSTLATVVEGGTLPSDFSIGSYLWVNGQYVRTANLKSSVDKVRNYILADLAAYRYEVETGGFRMPDGSIIRSDETSQAKISAAYQIASTNPNTTINFKAATGWIQLTAPQMMQIAQTVGGYVQACFSAEQTHTNNLNAIASVEGLLSYDYSKNYWPVNSVYLGY